jgi:hypothetical protein
MTRCILKYLVRGVKPDRESQADLRKELYDCLPHAQSVVVLPVVDGFSVEMEIDDLGPFSRTSFEPYIAEHVVQEAVQIRCHLLEAPQLKLLKAHFS